MIDIKLLHNTWNHSIVPKNKLRFILKCYQQNVFTNHVHLIYMSKQDLSFVIK